MWERSFVEDNDKLKAKVANDEIYIAKLLKEKSQLQEKLSLKETDSSLQISTDTKCIQCDYWAREGTDVDP